MEGVAIILSIDKTTQLCYNYATNMKECDYMPIIMPIKEMRNTNNISDLAHKEQEPIFITKNGYSDLVIMSSELYDEMAEISKTDKAIFEARQEGGYIPLRDVIDDLKRKHYEKVCSYHEQ